ncbi:predicted protein [Chaetoceros tenuissimus]|uniref:Uncharacterized protein n=1 Tax=Chaetoceros tenuissimus TaxID=426638 RepID=A0AAD3CWX7_9STRA|nr:predicted protein [Chaetoceros tenuissimus]
MIANFHGDEGSNMARSWSKERIINAIWLLVSLCFCYAAILSYYQEQEVKKYLAGSFWDVQRGTGLLIVLGVAILFTLLLYLVLEFTSSTYLRDNKRNILLFLFYFIGLVTDIGLIVAVVLGTVDLHSMWEKFIMFKYSVDPFMFITFWSSLPEKWRVFYSRHHSASMIIVGVWFSLHSDFTTTMLKAAVIWLTADLLGNIASMHRIIYSSRLAKKKVLDILIVIFIFQRIQRVSSLIYVGLFEEWPWKVLSALIFSSALVMDTFDACVQFIGILNRWKRLKDSSEESEVVDTNQGLDEKWETNPQTMHIDKKKKQKSKQPPFPFVTTGGTIDKSISRLTFFFGAYHSDNALDFHDDEDEEDGDDNQSGYEV